MAFESGPLSTLGISASVITQTAQTANSAAAVAGLQQVWQGAGKSFFGQAGQALTGNLAGSAVNIALNSRLGSQVAGPGGIKLDSGANLLASTITPYVTSTVAAGINQTINNSLKNSGRFAGVLSGISTSLVNQAFGGITNAIFNGAAGGFASSYKSFPGGSDSDPDASGSAHTLDEVVFSIQPANQGPQAFGDASFALSSSITKLPVKDFTKVPFNANNYTANLLKGQSMLNNVAKTQTTFTAAGPFPDSTLNFSRL
jgi:hypothetical protein